MGTLAVAWIAICGAASGQTAPGRAAFEVASLKRASKPIATKDEYTEGYNAGMRAAMAGMGIRISGRTVRVTDNSLRDLIRLAYQVKEYQISGPAWITEDLFEIAATMPEGATRAQVPEMMQRLLEERFHLELKREIRTMAVFALVATKGAAPLTPASAARGGPGTVDAARGHIRGVACTLGAFADLLTKAVERPVVDATAIAGAYDFDLSYAPALGAPDADNRPGLETALREQYGLRLERREMPVEILVVARADRAFQEN